jgi:hypothetical protein
MARLVLEAVSPTSLSVLTTVELYFSNFNSSKELIQEVQ